MPAPATANPSSAAAPAPVDLKARRDVMAICAEATREELQTILALAGWPSPASDARPVETGLVMLRGRMGGDGRPFNMGEASVTRASVVLPDGRIGFAYQLGRDKEKTRVAAVIDALWQGPERGAVENALEPVRDRLARAALTQAQVTAATKVNFFTMVRGED